MRGSAAISRRPTCSTSSARRGCRNSSRSTHDSGPLHLARLAGVPAIGLFGPTPPAIFIRDDPRVVTLWPATSMPCAPCYDGRNFAACNDNRCMQLITAADVMRRLESLLSIAH